MKWNRKMVTLSVFACLVLAACGNNSAVEQAESNGSNEMTSSSSEESDASMNEEASTETSDEASVDEEGEATSDDPSDEGTEENTNDHTEGDSEEESSESSEVAITSGSSAVDYLKRELEADETQNIDFEDIVFREMGPIQTDDGGSYYTVQLTSKSLKEKGGSGTVGLYKVYEDGTYELN
ncbi:hypothetical protein [Guptibacillus hwajinpoensis]|uniref:hypothetical protein n=1 Tax=Guptibacillus hwajinpoensis TaxID=208199 RepID=UPI0024B3AA92|nr:hypothetical protein [Pseudalkalibacillus hwajinpoensis]